MARDKRKRDLSMWERDELDADEVHAFVNNAQIALAGPEIDPARLDYLSSYSIHLEEILRDSSSLSPHEMAFVLVSVAYRAKYPKGGRV